MCFYRSELESSLSATKADVARKRALLEKRKKEADSAPIVQQQVDEEKRKCEDIQKEVARKEKTISDLRKQLIVLREESSAAKSELYELHTDTHIISY